MKKKLVKNICRLPRYAMNNDVKDLESRREMFIGVPLAYACSSWAKHLLLGTKAEEDTRVILNLVNYFFERNFLSWLEVLSTEGSFHVAIHSLHDMKLWLTNVSIFA
jgi:phosphatidylserine synthase